jgi:hypothetical protein
MPGHSLKSENNVAKHIADRYQMNGSKQVIKQVN